MGKNFLQIVSCVKYKTKMAEASGPLNNFGVSVKGSAHCWKG